MKIKQEILSGFQAAAAMQERLFMEKCVIFRKTAVKKDGVTQFEERLVGECCGRLSSGLSWGKHPVRNQEKIENRIEHCPVLYCSTQVDILPGDKITINRFGKKIDFSASLPVDYYTHKQVLLQHESEA